jgi:hypothetical protein
MTNKNFSATVGIPTCYSGESLVRTVESIRNADMGQSVRILVTADRTPMTKSVKDRLQQLKVEVTWNQLEGSQFKKINQMIVKAKTDIYIHTQDDVIFDSKTITSILDAFTKDRKLTMAGVRILPLPQINLFESAMASMLLIVDSISGKWKKSDNYLSSSGRCLAFRTQHLKKFRIPEAVVNGDMFFYLENKKLNGHFRRLDTSKVFIRCPQKLSEQLAPSSRHLYSKKEMEKYFTQDLDAEYKIPLQLVISSLFKVLAKRPIATMFYLAIRIYTYVNRQSEQAVSNPLWKVETSTKSV